jgi:hypothetical protein
MACRPDLKHFLQQRHLNAVCKESLDSVSCSGKDWDN